MQGGLKNYLSGKLPFRRLKYTRLYKLFFYSSGKKQEKKELDFYRSFLSPCTLIFDIGANDGHKSVAFAFFAKKIIACEPDPHNLKVLHNRFRRSTIIIIEPFALNDQSGTVELYIHKPGSALNTINPYFKKLLEKDDLTRWNEPIQFSGQVISVPCTTLDTLITAHGIPDFIKIDVEGNEWKVLSGLTHSINQISFEVLLPEFCKDALSSMEWLMKLNKNYRFNYAIEDKLVLPAFIEYEEFIRYFKKIAAHHIEVIASCISQNK